MENPAKQHENFANWSPDTSISQKEICLCKKQCGLGEMKNEIEKWAPTAAQSLINIGHYG